MQKDREVAAAYQANGTPGAILIGPDGKVASVLAMGSQAIVNLIATGARSRAVSNLPLKGSNGTGGASQPAALELKIGEVAPSLRLPDLSGRIVNLADFKQQETLVLFWNPTCGFCARMLPDLKQWEEDRAADAPQLLVVSTGSVEANQAMGLRSQVVLDQEFAAGRAFHVQGTPAAVLVDPRGNVASGVASGAPAVLNLATSRPIPAVIEIGD